MEKLSKTGVDMYGMDAYSRLMQQAGGQGNPDYQINVDSSMGNFNPQANSGNDGMIGSILSKALSSYGPVGGAVGGGVGAILDSGSKVSGPGEDRGLGQSVAQGAMKGAVGNMVNNMISSPQAGDLGSATSQAADATVNAGGNSLLASDALNSSTQLGDAYKVSLMDGQRLAGSDSVYQGANPTMQTGASSFGDKAGSFATNQFHGMTQGLFDKDVAPTEQTKDFTLDNMMKGYSEGGSLGKIRANLGAGNFGSAIGGGAKFVSNNYKPPAYDADKYKKQYMIKY